LKASAQSTDAQLAVQQAEVERARALLARKRQQVAALRVPAGVAGVLRQIGDLETLQVGQRVTPSATLAKIVEPSRLKAVLKSSRPKSGMFKLGKKPRSTPAMASLPATSPASTRPRKTGR